MKNILISLTLGLALTLIMLTLLPVSFPIWNATPAHAANDVIYVDQNAIGDVEDGTSWETAHKSLQNALDEAEATDQIWVAAGVYTPTNGITSTATFQLIDEVAIYGGFEGGNNDEDINSRQWWLNVSILSGDLEGDDTTMDGIVTNTDNISGTNAYHVVTGSSVTNTAILDGFTITAGSADGSYDDDKKGGGMFNRAGNPTVNNVTFRCNRAANGGGMYNDNSNPRLVNVRFQSNQANNGGGMMNWESNPTLLGVIFTKNQANGYYGGGGMFNRYSSPLLTQVTFRSNEANNNNDGGGMNNYPDGNPTLSNVTFVNNLADRYGGGMFNRDSTPTLTDVIFRSNQADENGGGILNHNSDAKLTNITFAGNQAIRWGGGLMNILSNPKLVNILFSGNYAGEDGGGIYNSESNSTLTNITFSGNQAESGSGGGIYNNSGHLTLVNTILWGDRDSTGVSEIFGDDTITVIACNIEGSQTGTDPWFITPIPASSAPTIDGNYHLLIGSPIIDTGNNLNVDIDSDLDGNLRIVDGERDGDAIVDMGAYEFYPQIYVDQAVLGTEHDGLFWTSAFTNIQDALNIATSGNEIWVARGTYYPDEGKEQINNVPTATFQLKEGVKLYGGFVGGLEGEKNLEERNWSTNLTILSGDLGKDDTTENGIVTSTSAISGTNAFHVVRSDNVFETTRLDGFTITAGNASGNNNRGDGGGMFNNGSNPTVANVTFRGNRATSNGGSMYNHESNPTLVNVAVTNNQANNGGGMYNNAGSSPTLVNVTFGGNQAINNGGGIYNDHSALNMTNAILWANQARNETAIYNTESCTPTISYSNMSGDPQPGINNLNLEPYFADPDRGNYRLSLRSPLIDRGNNANINSTFIADLDDNPRIVDGDDIPGAVVDMGAYEFQINTLSVSVENSELGSVSSIPEGIACPDDCTQSYPEGSTITLVATPLSKATFSGWDGPCNEIEGNTCLIILDVDKNVTATFAIRPESRVYLPLVLR